MSQNTNFNQNNIRNLGISGKYVNDFTEITANDVPMDIPSSVFIKSDGSEIQIRSWNGQGLIDTRTYKPILADSNSKAISSNEDEKTKIDLSQIFSDLFKKLDDIESKLDKPKTTARAKKEADAE